MFFFTFMFVQNLRLSVFFVKFYWQIYWPLLKVHFEIKINMLLKADFSLLDLKFKYYIVNEYSVCTRESV